MVCRDTVQDTSQILYINPPGTYISNKKTTHCCMEIENKNQQLVKRVMVSEASKRVVSSIAWTE